MKGSDARRYRMLGVIGKGGFGKVYRARLEGPEGFVKDVAVKLLSDEHAPEEVLRRFRDESRILGLVRDRAIVGVDPPTRLAGKWAVVMEFVDGLSCSRMLSNHGVLPPRVALEITAEVARALDKLYQHPGPDGTPLRVLHRDIKPHNIQVTPAGQVKILDFGIARADFDNRESATTHHIGGTFGYIAPERLEGDDGPECDVYSLGVVLKVFVTGKRPGKSNRELAHRSKVNLISDTGPTPPDLATDEVPIDAAKDPSPQADDPALAEVLALAERMTDSDPAARPTAREVEELCLELAERQPRPNLRRWAEDNIPPMPPDKSDELVGSVFAETTSAQPEMTGEFPDRQQQRPRVWPMLLAVGAVFAAGVVVLGGTAVLAGGMGFVAAMQSPTPTPQAEPAVAVTPDPVAPAPVAPDPAPVAPAPAEVAPAAPEPVEPGPAAKPAPSTQPAPAPAPKPEAGPSVKLIFSSAPMGAEVWVDGKHVGQTPLVDVSLTAGSHQVRMTLDGASIERTVKVAARGPTTFVWSGGDAWEARY